jgi:fluoroquinolone resistance protein
METITTQDKNLDHQSYAGLTLSNQEFESCIFQHCDFSETIFYGVVFIDCQFFECNFSLAKLNDTALRNAHFVNCKLIGNVFSLCHPLLFSVTFDQCVLDYTSFSKRKMKKSRFTNCSIIEAQFVESDLTESTFLGCNLHRTLFQQSILEKVDFRSSQNYSMDLDQNRVKKAKFALAGVPGLLEKYGLNIEL